MDRTTAVVLTAAAGGLIALQAPINSHARQGGVGTFQAALRVVRRSAPPRSRSWPRWPRAASASSADARGAVLVLRCSAACWARSTSATVLVTVRTLGAGGVTAATIAGQLTMAVVVDQFGLLGVEKAPVTAAELAGIVLLAVGVVLVVRD